MTEVLSASLLDSSLATVLSSSAIFFLKSSTTSIGIFLEDSIICSILRVKATSSINLYLWQDRIKVGFRMYSSY